MQNGLPQTETFTFRPFNMTNRTGDSLMMVYRDQREVLYRPFAISPGIVIPVADYTFDDLGMRLGTGNHRKFAGFLMYVTGDFYDGTRININGDETMGANLRVVWIPEAGKELYFVINQNLEDFDRDNSFHSATADVTAKVSYTFRF